MGSSETGDRRIYRASTTAPVNIAVIKYWGKRDPTLNLPTNSSLSVTLTQSSLRAYTTASCSPLYTHDTLHLNHLPQDLTTPRTAACLRSLRLLRLDLERLDPSLPPLSTYPLRISSTNNFPTAAGLASSAAGFAALVRSIADLYSLPQTPQQLSLIARQGSGSACRSLFGGYVAWQAGTLADGSDSLARQLFPAAHWPGLRALILVISSREKDVSSTKGMQATVATSALFGARVDPVVPRGMAQMEAAIRDRDFARFGELAMRDSNNFHATCADTWPPIFYMDDASRAAVRVCERVNEGRGGRVVCAYTFDAGPNAVVFYEEEEEGYVLGAFRAIVGDAEGWEDASGDGQHGQDGESRAVDSSTPHSQHSPPPQSPWHIDERTTSVLRAGVSHVILTGVGQGPISRTEHLIDEHGNVLGVR